MIECLGLGTKKEFQKSIPTDYGPYTQDVVLTLAILCCAGSTILVPKDERFPLYETVMVVLVLNLKKWSFRI